MDLNKINNKKRKGATLSIHKSYVLQCPEIIPVILKNTPMLDPLSIFLNSKLFFIESNKKIVSFVTLKKFGKMHELGTVYTDVNERGKGYAKRLIQYVISSYCPIALLCNPELKEFYERAGFRNSINCMSIVNARRNLFNIFLAPILKHKIISMKYIQ